MQSMSLNGRIALVALAALLVFPIWLPLLPAGYIWWRRLRTQARAQGLRELNALQARAIFAHAEATLPAPPKAKVNAHDSGRNHSSGVSCAI